ncbi:hypothetical protein HK096_008724, partial [Nowakowskiella sp. JEL0078]
FHFKSTADTRKFSTNVENIENETIESSKSNNHFDNGFMETSENDQKSILKLLKILVDSDEGRASFAECKGQEILTEVLGKVIPQIDFTTMASNNSIPSLLLTVLRTAAQPAQLPSHHLLNQRNFQIELERSSEKISKPIREFCPEFEMDSEENGPASRNEAPVFEAVRHVQSFWDGLADCVPRIPHTRICVIGSEGLNRRPNNNVKKILFEQTAQILRSSSTMTPIVVFDLLDPKVATKSDARTLLFDSRFESGNLQLASKISEFEYDLILESDINTEMGKHNQ